MTQTEKTQPETNPVAAPVLLIEDEPAVMAFVRTVLEGRGYSVLTTESGAAALHLLESGNFHGVITDMRTPGGVDGGIGGEHHYEYSNVYWNLAGLKAAIDAARWLGKDAQAAEWQKE